MQFIQNAALPLPAGHYSQAVRAGGFVYLSGVLPIPGIAGFEPQARDALERCGQILGAAGCCLDDVVHCTAYIVGVANWSRFNAVYAEVFGDHRPARTVVPVTELHHGSLVEVQMTAWRE